ncbi:CCHC-type domain-containing protein [Trichonephila inaurata madagascariensis]|uniref:CCHC-type domain-containing protein n=1 Tax=Trichonephila inaurata madagascariensis TaxID=2747483 RepID=A0A8X7C631_9ARAC|nr:CCHC-type domain-containing protein [Trichonephila inaurata madagascariensis]
MMMCDRHCDTLSISIPDMKEVMKVLITKITILAASHKIFDPIGITSTAMLPPKLWLRIVFLRVNNETTAHVHVVHSKARIAPSGKKETMIARLELLGATISVRLYPQVLKEFHTDCVYFWTDSTTVLAWLKREDT